MKPKILIFKPWANVLWAPGKNCHMEMLKAFEDAGANPHLVLINRLISGKEKLSDCDLFGDPGGFGWGDHIRAGWIQAIDFVYRFGDQIMLMVKKKIPMLGVCNGFQDFTAAGILGGKLGEPGILMDTNSIATFQHWTDTKVIIHDPGDCVWLSGLDRMAMFLPSSHGEGRVVELAKRVWHIAATYGTYEGQSDYPISPNGSRVAGISQGNIFALMPHPERKIFKRVHGGNEGLLIFKNAVRAVT